MTLARATSSSGEAAAEAARRPTVALTCTTALYALALVFHTVDHLRRGLDSVTPEVLVAGIVSTLAAVVTIGLVFSKNRVAPAAAAAVGFTNAAGVTAVHLLPRWSAFSDAFPGGSADATSWAIVLLEIGSAFALGVAGLSGMRRA